MSDKSGFILRLSVLLLLGIILLNMMSSGAIALPSVFPTGTTRYDPKRAYNSYVLFSAPDGNTHLVDMNGNEVHSWNKFGFPAEMIDPAQNGGVKGHILLQLKNGSSPFGNIFANQEVGELDWKGAVVWRYGNQAPGENARQNHDINRLPNGNTLLVTTVDRVVAGVSNRPIADQQIVEVSGDGKVVWSWTVGDHIDEFGITDQCGGRVPRHQATAVRKQNSRMPSASCPLPFLLNKL